MVVEVFLRGCKDKEVVYLVMEMNFKSIYKVLKYVKFVVNNCKVLFGLRVNYYICCVSF